MTEILPTSCEFGQHRRHRTMKKHSVRTDMTPMVDLGFLLITFFVFTAELSKPAVMKLNMPREESDSMLVGSSNALTILLGTNDGIYYYHGNWNEAFSTHQVFKTNLSVTNGVGKVIRDKQRWLDLNNKKEKRNGLVLLIKAGNGATYKNVIDALDETLINAVTRYTLLPADPEENTWMEKQPG
jgi:biopolymer transport protein ExbD